MNNFYGLILNLVYFLMFIFSSCPPQILKAYCVQRLDLQYNDSKRTSPIKTSADSYLETGAFDCVLNTVWSVGQRANVGGKLSLSCFSKFTVDLKQKINFRIKDTASHSVLIDRKTYLQKYHLDELDEGDDNVFQFEKRLTDVQIDSATFDNQLLELLPRVHRYTFYLCQNCQNKNDFFFIVKTSNGESPADQDSLLNNFLKEFEKLINNCLRKISVDSS